MNATARPTVSVCIATYNQAAYIQDCILSVLAQAQDAELEILVGDDCSSDGTVEIVDALARHAPQVVRVPRVENLGPTRNYQDLVRRATGGFIAHLDGDDAWLPGKLRAQLACLVAQPECIAVYTNGIALDTQGQLRGYFSRAGLGQVSLDQLCSKGNFLLHSSTMYRAQYRDAFLQLRPPVIDWALHLAFAKQGPLALVDIPLVVYRVATATSLARHSYAWLETELWKALRDAMTELPRERQQAAAAHFIAQQAIARLRGKTASWQSLLAQVAQAVGLSSAELALRALPDFFALGAHGAFREGLRKAGAAQLMAENYRL